MSKTQKKASQTQQALALLGSGALMVAGTLGLMWFMNRANAPTLVATCPPVTTTRVALIAATVTSNDSYTSYDGELLVFDVMNGALVSKNALSSWRDTAQRAVCLGQARPGTFWLRNADALSIRDGNTGAVVASPEAIVAKNPVMRVGVLNWGWDVDASAPTVSLRDGHSLLLDATTLETSRYAGNVTMNPFGYRADEVIRSQAVTYYVGGLPGLLLTDNRQITLDGHPRSVLKVGGEPLFGDRDFYMPSMLVNPQTGRVEWPDPPSLLIVEETLVGSLKYRITRIGLDGRVIFTYEPPEALPAGFMYRPIPWTSAATGARLLHFGGESFIGLDTRTGRVLYETSYRGEPVTR